MPKVLIVQSSPRKNSNTRALVERVDAGATGKGHEVSILDVAHARIGPCTGCDACQNNGGKCVIKDSMEEFYPRVLEAEIIVFASPVYYFSVNAQMKLFIDRTYCLGVGALEGKRVGGVFVYGDVDPVKSGCVNAIRMFQDICAYCSAEWVGAVYGSAMAQGEIAGNAEVLALGEEFGRSL